MHESGIFWDHLTSNVFFFFTSFSYSSFILLYHPISFPHFRSLTISHYLIFFSNILSHSLATSQIHYSAFPLPHIGLFACLFVCLCLSSCLFICLSASLYLFVCLYLSVYFCLTSSLSLSFFCLSFRWQFICLFGCSTVSPTVSMSIYFAVSVSKFIFHLSLYLYVLPSVFLSVYPFICFSVYLSPFWSVSFPLLFVCFSVCLDPYLILKYGVMLRI